MVCGLKWPNYKLLISQFLVVWLFKLQRENPYRCRIRQGLGVATCNAAEYHAVILGLKKALEMGYTSIQALDDSKLVCMQVTF